MNVGKFYNCNFRNVMAKIKGNQKKKKTMCQQYSLYLFNFYVILWMKPD